jgi:hypothetical protein
MILVNLFFIGKLFEGIRGLIGTSSQPRVRSQRRSHPQVRPQHLPSVLQRTIRRHWIHKGTHWHFEEAKAARDLRDVDSRLTLPCRTVKQPPMPTSYKGIQGLSVSIECGVVKRELAMS